MGCMTGGVLNPGKCGIVGLVNGFVCGTVLGGGVDCRDGECCCEEFALES